MQIKGQKLTKYFCLIALIVIVVYDVWVMLAYGVDATISRIVINLRVIKIVGLFPI